MFVIKMYRKEYKNCDSFPQIPCQRVAIQLIGGYPSKYF